MALDSEEKRRAAAGCHPCTPILPVPTGAIDTPFRRAAVQWIYFLGEVTVAVLGTFNPTLLIRGRRRRRG